MTLSSCVIFVQLKAVSGDGSAVVDIFSAADGSWTTAVLSAARRVSATSLQLPNTELVLFGGDAGTILRKD